MLLSTADEVHLGNVYSVKKKRKTLDGPCITGDWIIFHCLIYQFFCQLNLYVLSLYHLKYYHIMFIIIVFWLGSDGPSGLLFFRAGFTYFHAVSALLTFFCLFVLFILAVPMRQCLRKHSCMSSTLPIALLNGTCFFRQSTYKCAMSSERKSKLVNLNLYKLTGRGWISFWLFKSIFF